ncbi:hypothetical protein [Sphingomonas sp.]|uniref:hypothetical protein n=1 Tax=Sphingomonas sp. TaxID=28214 RepID=UPI0025EC2205|nr:hypothetical protein [Sphingomonas sp.]
MRKLMFVMAIAVGTAAQAQEAARPMISPACRAEVAALCPATGDRGARRACMMEKQASVSGPCKAELKAAMEARRAARGAEGGQPRGDMGGMGDHGSDGPGQPQ